MIGRTTASVGLVVGAALLTGGLIAACSNDPGGNQSVAGGPGTGGAHTGGGGAGGGTVLPTGGSGGGTAGGSGGGKGLPQVDGKCPPNSLKHADDMLCYCQPSTLTACPDACGDLMTDPDRCGDCTTKCGPAQACSAGKCGADPTVVVPAAPGCGGMHLAAKAGKLYWTNTMAGTLSSVATTGGAATVLVPAVAASKPTQIAVTDKAIFWLASGTNSVMTAALPAGGAGMAVFTSPATPATPTDAIHGFTLSADGTTLYFTAGKTVSKTTAAPGGTPAEVGHEDTGIPQGLALSAAGDYIGYPADVNGDIDVMHVVAGMPSVCSSNVGGSGGGGGGGGGGGTGGGGGMGGEAPNMNCNRLGRSQGDLILDTIFIVGDAAYWANATEITTSSISMPTGANTTIASVGLVNAAALKVSAFTVAGGKVYFADKPLDTDQDPTHSGYIYQAALTESAPITIMARGQKGPTSIAVDDTNVYWATGDCAIMSMPLK